MKAKSFTQWLVESSEDVYLSADEVAELIEDTTPNEEDVPTYFINKIKRSKRTFRLEDVEINWLLKQDSDLKSWVEEGEERYEDEDLDWNDIYQPAVVVDGELMDGWSRIQQLWRADEPTIKAWVAQ
jgi:hypothetical protein